MKKHGFRIAIFVLSFSVGIIFVAVLNFVIFDKAVSENDTNAKTERIVSNKSDSENILNTLRKGTEDIEIDFKGFVETENGIAIDFFITNYSSTTYTYRSFSNGENSEPIPLLAQLKINGEIINQMHCGTGLIEYELKSGETKQFRYLAFNLSYHWKNRKSVQIGYHFGKKIDEDPQIIWSEELPISDSIAEKLLKEQTQR